MALRRASLAALVAALALGAIADAGGPHEPRLTARPGPGGGSCSPGTHTLSLGPGRRALMRVGPGRASGRRPLLLALHGYGGSSEDGLSTFRGGWRTPGLVLVAPAAESQGWNPFLGSDLNSLDRALKRAFGRCRIDPQRIGVGGHSDGAGNALTFGLANGDLLSAVVAIAPGALVVQRTVGMPRVLVAHGIADRTIPIRKSTAIVRRLRADGYAVDYRRFRGGHEVPLDVSRDAVWWFLTRR